MANESIYKAFERMWQHTGARLANIEGDSAYDIWLSQGNSGTEEDFLNSLIGPAGQYESDNWIKICHDTLKEGGIWQSTGASVGTLFKAKQDWKGYFYFYVANISNVSELYWEISSSTTYTGNCVRYLIREGTGLDKLVNGWNKIEFVLHDSNNLSSSWSDDISKSFSDNYAYYLGSDMIGNVNWANINYVRLIVTPKNTNINFDYYVNALTIYDPMDVSNTLHQIWVNNTEAQNLAVDSSSSQKPTVSWTPNNFKEGSYGIKCTINDANGAQVLSYKTLQSRKLRKFSMVITLSNTQYTTAGAFYLSTLKDNSTSDTHILCCNTNLTANNYIIIRFEGSLENWWKCYGIENSNTTDNNRYNFVSTKYLSYPLGTRTKAIKQEPIEFLQLNFGATDGALPAGTTIELWGVEYNEGI